MTTERQACGLGSFLPMSCRGRAEAFARRLQSRLQSLGRAGSGDGASTTADENSWLARQSEVTSHQPRLSSSSESDIYFDFDLDCESPGSPIEETTYSETFPDYLVNKSHAFQRPPRTQYSSESGCVLSSSTISGTSPDSDSSDGLYFDTENLDAEVSGNCQNKHEHNHEGSPEVNVTHSAETKAPKHVNGPTWENNPYVKMNGCALDLTQESENQDEIRRVGKRNFRNSAGFRVSSEEREINKNTSECCDTTSKDASERDVNPISISECSNLGSFSSDGSIGDEYFECISSKPEDFVSDELKSLCLHDSGYPNTAESSRCSSQNETRLSSTETTETNDCSSSRIEECNPEQVSSVPNEKSGIITQRPNEILLCSEETSSSIPDVQSTDITETEFSSTSEQEPTVSCLNKDETQLEPTFCSSQLLTSAEALKEVHNSNEYNNSHSSSESLYTSTLSRPSKLTIECPVAVFNDVTTECKSIRETRQSEKKHTECEDDDDDDDSNRVTPRVRRCSSLKSGKTPPGTPGRKKIVRFADVLGLDLADIRTFLDEIPKVPLSAYDDLQCADITDAPVPITTEGTRSEVLVPTCIISKPDRCLIPLFQQPGGQLDFMDRVREGLVCLENAVVTDPVSYSISGTVRVRNLDFHKSVHVRYSIDGWNTFADLQTTYLPNSCDGFSDKFSFVLYAHTVQIGQRLEFAIRFQCKGSQYWDSNHGTNYAFQCLPPADHTPYMPLPISPDEHFSTSFY